MAGEAAAEAGAHLAERQVDLVVDDEHALERHAQRAARRADAAAGVVHVGQRLEQRDARAAGPGAALAQPSAVALARALEAPAPASSSATAKPMLCRVPVVLATRVAEPDDEPVDARGRARGSAATRRRRRTAPPAASSARLVLAAAASASPTSSVSCSISSSSSRRSRGGVRVAITISSSSPSSVTPSGAVSAESSSVSPIAISETSWLIDSGIEVGSASTSDAVGDVLEHAALAHAGRRPRRRSSTIGDGRLDRLVEAHADEIDVHHVAAHGVALGVLEHGRRRPAAVDRELEHGAAARASAVRSSRAPTAKLTGSPPPP